MKLRWWSEFARRLRDERGILLVEQMVAAALAAFLFGVVLYLFGIATRTGQHSETRGETLLTAREGLERMLKEARVALPVAGQSPAVSAGSLVFQRVAAGADPDLPLASQPKRWVRWTCSGGTCDRSSSTTYPPPAGGATLVEDVTNSDVFTLVGTNLVQVRLVLSVANHVPDHEQRPGQTASRGPVEIQDGVYMRSVP